MSDDLSVAPQGLRAASAALDAHTALMPSANDAVSGDKASLRGAAGVAAAIEDFSKAYGGRISDHAHSLRLAAGSYVDTDQRGADDIGIVSI